MKPVRASGILLHPTSLPGPHGSGDLGPSAYHFIDWLALAGQRLWQVLPLGGLGPGHSPYMSSSAFAGNLMLIDLQDLQRQGWLTAEQLQPDAAFQDARVNFDAVLPWRMTRLASAAQAFGQGGEPRAQADFEDFQQAEQAWLPDYALYMALSEALGEGDWTRWPTSLRQREATALAAARQTHAGRIQFWAFCQWRFFRQWAALRRHAHDKGVRLVGDAPIFIAHQSADVWAHPQLFLLDDQGRPGVVAGVPPDYFSATGQRWGNPLYDWPAHQASGFDWWIARIRHSLAMVDVLRIDHFRGFEDYWEIPASEPTAIQGRWVRGPGAALFEALRTTLGAMPIIAEDLGIITPEVERLRRQFGFPGMRILHFAFGGAPDNPYLPHNYEANTVAYTGTHDNNTTQGWWAQASAQERDHLWAYLDLRPGDEADLHWKLIQACCASVADTVIHPMQDVLGLPAECRMNTPGTAEGNWGWRFEWSQVQPWHAGRLAAICQRYGRL